MKTNQLPKRKNFNNQKYVQSLTPIGMSKLLVRYKTEDGESMWCYEGEFLEMYELRSGPTK